MFDKITATEMFYFGCAVFGGTVFILRSVMLLIGMGGDNSHEIGGDADADTAIGGEHDGNPMQDFRMVSLQTVTAFIFMFGLSGFLLRHNGGGLKVWIADLVAVGVGLFTMFITAKLFQTANRLQSDGTIYPKDTIGAEGTVYITIRPGETGQVRITVRESLRIMDARAADPAATIKTGDPVKVIAAGDILTVERL